MITINRRGREPLRGSLPDFDKGDRCPGWSGEGWRHNKVDWCDARLPEAWTAGPSSSARARDLLGVSSARTSCPGSTPGGCGARTAATRSCCPSSSCTSPVVVGVPPRRSRPGTPPLWQAVGELRYRLRRLR